MRQPPMEGCHVAHLHRAVLAQAHAGGPPESQGDYGGPVTQAPSPPPPPSGSQCRYTGGPKVALALAHMPEGLARQFPQVLRPLMCVPSRRPDTLSARVGRLHDIWHSLIIIASTIIYRWFIEERGIKYIGLWGENRDHGWSKVHTIVSGMFFHSSPTVSIPHWLIDITDQKQFKLWNGRILTGATQPELNSLYYAHGSEKNLPSIRCIHVEVSRIS